MDRLRQMRFHRTHPDVPWLTASAVDVLDQWLRPSDYGLEWGSGRSTAWFARRISHLTSVEESPKWGPKVDHMLIKQRLRDRVDLHVVQTDPTDDSAANPYVRVSANIAPASIDFALIDGDLRDHCALAALPLLKPGGLLIIDDVERYMPRMPPTRSPNARKISEGYASTTWESLAREISGWRRIWTSDGVSDTALWMKPWSAKLQ